MDKISELLREAKPLYRRRQLEKKAFCSLVFSLCLVLGLWFYQPKPVDFDEESFDSYFTALYMNDGSEYDIVDDDVLPVDAYGLYEV